VVWVGPIRSGACWRVRKRAIALGATTLAFFVAGLTNPTVDAALACKKAHAHARTAPRHQVRGAVICLVNHARSRHHVNQLVSSRRLKRAAERHSRRMVTGDCFAHQCPGEEDLLTRIRRTGYTRKAKAWSVGEDLGVEKSAIQIVRAWMHSPPHRRVLLGKFEDLGIGVRWGSPGRRGSHKATFTLDAGWRRR
jgi:uncharacterized protein YkwD